MKKTIYAFLCLTSIFTITFINNVNAQVTKENVREYLAAFENAWNKEDVDALMNNYTDNAVFKNSEGTVVEGKQALRQMNAGILAIGKSFLMLKDATILSVDGSTAVVTGKWQLLLKTTEGLDTALNGAYINTMVMENGKLKIAEMAHTNLVKTMITFKIADWEKWNTGFESITELRKQAGELTYEMGLLEDKPSVVYVITEWASADAAKSFLANPSLKDRDVLESFGIAESYGAMILGKKLNL